MEVIEEEDEEERERMEVFQEELVEGMRRELTIAVDSLLTGNFRAQTHAWGSILPGRSFHQKVITSPTQPLSGQFLKV